jgi:hypothetical protein
MTSTRSLERIGGDLCWERWSFRLQAGRNVWAEGEPSGDARSMWRWRFCSTPDLLGHGLTTRHRTADGPLRTLRAVLARQRPILTDNCHRPCLWSDRTMDASDIRMAIVVGSGMLAALGLVAAAFYSVTF